MELDLQRLESLLPKYDIPGPRYTSYPTVPVWNESYAANEFETALRRIDASASRNLAFYIHVPFCRELCHYCACNRVITRKEELPNRYLEVIGREIEALRACLPGEAQVSQVHLGGGTPTHLEPAQLDELMTSLTRAFPASEAFEFSIEVDPRVTTDAHVASLRAWGFERISLGVQDFDSRVQRAIHRIQPPEMVRALTRSVRDAGFTSVNFDLIYGLPFQSVASFDRTLDLVFSMQPDRVALYSYAHVSWFARQQRGFERVDLPSGDRKLEIMLHAIRRFLDEGYVHIGMDHFAKRDDALARAAETGQLRRNFMGYTTQVVGDLIGLGPSAISECAGDYAQSYRDLAQWEDAVLKRGLATFRGHSLCADDRRRNWVIRQIMCTGRLSGVDYRKEFDRGFGGDFEAELCALQDVANDGLVVLEGDDGFRVTATGSLLLRNLAMIFDSYLPAQHGREQPIFSKTI